MLAGIANARPLVVQSPWLAPDVLAMLGHSPEDGNEPVMLIAFEAPREWMRSMERAKKEELEWLYVQRFRADHRLALGYEPFGNVDPAAIRRTFWSTTASGQ